MDNHLTVVLVPSRRIADERSRIRVAVELNAEWYRDFCGAFSRTSRGRKVKTTIRRRETRLALEEMIQGCATSVYAQRLLPYVNARSKQDRVPF